MGGPCHHLEQSAEHFSKDKWGTHAPHPLRNHDERPSQGSIPCSPEWKLRNLIYQWRVSALASCQLWIQNRGKSTERGSEISCPLSFAGKVGVLVLCYASQFLLRHQRSYIWSGEREDRPSASRVPVSLPAPTKPNNREGMASSLTYRPQRGDSTHQGLWESH